MNAGGGGPGGAGTRDPGGGGPSGPERASQAGWLERVLDSFVPVRGKRRRSLMWLAALAILGVALVAVGSTLPGAEAPQKGQSAAGGDSETSPSIASGGSYHGATDLEASVAAVLGRVQGAGRVLVKLTLADSGTTSLAENTTDETEEDSDLDSQGRPAKTTSRRRTTREVMTVPGGSQGDRPVVIRVKAPEIVGVLVVAEGAADPITRERLVIATATLLGCPPHRVAVVPEGGDLR